MNPKKTEAKKNWRVIVGRLSFLMGGTEEMSKAEALRSARMIWANARVE